MSAAHAPQQRKIFGLIAEFKEPHPLVEAAKKAYRGGYRAMDAYTPYPVEGLAEAIGFHKNGVAPIVFIGGVIGALTGFGMQHFASVIHYAYDVGGKPFFSWPAFIPVTFELMVLVASFACLGAMLGLNGLPRPHHPIFNARRFERASNDRFFLCIEASDPLYDPEKTRTFLEGLGPVEVSEVRE